MTITDTATIVPAIAVAGDPAPTRPRGRDVIAQLRAEGIRRKEAGEFLNYMRHVVAEVRRYDGTPFRPYDEDIESVYGTLDAVMPHGQISTRGSAHDLLERHLLDPSRGELGIMHDRAEDGELVYCAVTVTLNIYQG